MQGEVLIKVEGVSKKFCRNLKRSLWYGLSDLMRSIVGNSTVATLRKDEFWAVRNVSFEVRRGECLGLIGHNGAGKSTLLKMLNGLIRPDEGRIEMHGRIGALIELGAGFNPVLTGRENVYNNGAVLGFTKIEIDNKFEEIVAFAELGEFIDMPVQNYSSGMKVRLGFAVAAQMQPDILIIDEVLAVGDIGFVLKCFNIIDTILPKTAVIFVSHNMNQVSRICTELLLLDKGKEIYLSFDVSKGIDQYYSRFATTLKDQSVRFNRNDDAELISIKFEDEVPQIVFEVNRLDNLIFNIELKVRAQFRNPTVSLIFFDKEDRSVGICLNENGLSDKHVIDRNENWCFYKTQVTISRIVLSRGIYSVSLVILEDFRFKPILRVDKVKRFQVISGHDVVQPIEFEAEWN